MTSDIDANIKTLATRLYTNSTHPGAKQRFILTISGVPGSGKSFISGHLCHEINALAKSHGQSESIAVVVPMDGYHYTKAQLDQMEGLKNMQYIHLAPEFNEIRYSHRIVIVEGLYLQLASLEPWSKLRKFVDEAMWVEPKDASLAKDRLIARHMGSRVGRDYVTAKARAENNDIPNGQFIIENRYQPDTVFLN
ncbi:hypothetical protein H4219_000928 [Mycoemilia scoparia]|uniref:Phosphoribulokinase/uridine kinase domain-containing protein n=1 Tax=Mycoemilia scoparia TaxID=417184 RepID=A0A9W8A605_9FUNG|nr:hypothetical protein H4219_000928 [Mycoemilia scoparia]